MSADALLLSWKPPDSPNGPLLYYTIYWRMADNDGLYHLEKHDVASPHYKEQRGLEKFAKYEYKITATNTIGEGMPTPAVSQSPLPRVPARIASFGGAVTSVIHEDVTLECVSVGNPTPNRTWTLSKEETAVGFNKRSKVTESGSLVLYQITPLDQKGYTCKVQNIFGDDAIHYDLTVLITPGPVDVQVLLTTINSIHLTWATSPVPLPTDYVLSYRKYSEPWRKVVIEAEVTTFSLQGLSCGSVYSFFVVARNFAGEGRPSRTYSAKTQGAVPKLPRQEDLIETNQTTIRLHLYTWPNGGCPLTHFGIEIKRMDLAQWNTVADHVPASKEVFVIDNLRPKSWFSLRIAAHNEAGITRGIFSFNTKGTSPELLYPVLEETRRDSPYEGLHFIIPVISGCVCTLSILVCVCVVFQKRRGETYWRPPSPLEATDCEVKHLDDPDELPREGDRIYHTLRKLTIPSIPSYDPEEGNYSTLKLSPEYQCPNVGTINFQLELHNEGHQDCYDSYIPAPSLFGDDTSEETEFKQEVRVVRQNQAVKDTGHQPKFKNLSVLTREVNPIIERERRSFDNTLTGTKAARPRYSLKKMR